MGEKRNMPEYEAEDTHVEADTNPANVWRKEILNRLSKIRRSRREVIQIGAMWLRKLDEARFWDEWK